MAGRESASAFRCRSRSRTSNGRKHSPVQVWWPNRSSGIDVGYTRSRSAPSRTFLLWGHTRAICVTARGVLLDARFYCVLRISPVAHIDATCAPAIVRMDATHQVAIPAAWRVSVAAIRVMGVVVVVIPETDRRTAALQRQRVRP